MFAALPDKQPESWVKATNIAAVHSADFPQYKLKTLRLRHKSSQIDLESYTAQRFGLGDGAIEWTRLDCTK